YRLRHGLPPVGAGKAERAVEAAEAMSHRFVRTLYIATAFVALVPIWSAKYLPTSDGPSHLYNAYVLGELVRGHDGVLAKWYEVDWRPNPNWLSHIVLAVLLSIVPPAIAEKLLVSGIVILFLGATWIFASAGGEPARPWVFLTLPFA